MGLSNDERQELEQRYQAEEDYNHREENYKQLEITGPLALDEAQERENMRLIRRENQSRITKLEEKERFDQ